MTRPKPPLSILPAVALLTAAAAAQSNQGFGSGGPGTEFLHETSLPWSASPQQPGPLGRIVAGDFDGDLRADAFVRAGPAAPGSPGSHTVLHLPSPWTDGAQLVLPVTANDFDVQNGVPGSARFLYVDADGLKQLRFDWASVPPSPIAPYVSSTIAAGPIWQGAKKIRAAELDGLPSPDYAGVAADGRTVVLRRGPVGGTTTSLLNVGGDVLDVSPLQWVSGGPEEVLVLTAAGLGVLDAQASVISFFPLGTPAVTHVAVLRSGTGGPDKIAWAAPNAGASGWSVDVLQFAAPQSEGAIALVWSDVSGISAGDMDEDGDCDLAVVHTANHKVRMYANRLTDGFPRTFSTAHTEIVDHPTLAPTNELANTSVPAFADLGNDGRADLLVAVESQTATSFEVFRSGFQNGISSEDAFDESYLFPYADTPGQLLEVSFRISTRDYTHQATHVEVVAWTQPNASSYLDPDSDGPVRWYPIAASQQQTLADAWILPSVPLTYVGNRCDMPIRWLEVRLIRVQNGVKIQAWPTYVCAITMEQADYCALDNGDPTNDEIMLFPPILECAANGNCSSGGSWPAPSITRRRKAPPPPGVVPRIPVQPVYGPTIPG